MQPTYRKPTPPGHILRFGFLCHLKMTQQQFADHLKISLVTLNRIINNRTRISPALARKLGSALGTGPEFWLTAQMATDLWEIQQEDNSWPAPLVFEDD